MSEIAPFDPERIFTALMAHRVEFVLAGALAARLQGFPRMTADASLTPRRTPDNLERLATALRELEARVYTDSVPEGLSFDCTATALGRAEMWNLVTNAGRVDLIFTPAGTGGFDDLAPRAVTFTVYGGTLLAARLEDILQSKQASRRPAAGSPGCRCAAGDDRTARTGREGLITPAPGQLAHTCSEETQPPFQHPTSNIQHPTSNIQHPTANSQHPTSNIQHPTPYDLQPTTYDLQPP